jgi:hypothetical protein
MYCVSLHGSTAEYYYSLTTPQMGTPHIHIATTSTHFMEAFFLNKFIKTLFILQLLPKANPTGQLLEVQLLRNLFGDWRHLLQKLLVLLTCAIGG